MTWRSDSEPETIELFVGSLDEKSLIGEKVNAESKERIGGYGETLQKRIYHIWFENAIKGVTDYLKGPRFAEDSDEYP